MREVDRTGAAGGLAGAFAAIGGQLVDGFELVADELALFEQFSEADLVITGEGFLDEQSFDGKVVGGVVDLAAAAGVPVLAVVGDVYDGVEDRVDRSGFEAVSLVRRFGRSQAFEDPVGHHRFDAADRLRERTS